MARLNPAIGRHQQFLGGLQLPILAVTLLALTLRLFRINAQSAWIDEAFTIHAALQPWDEMLRILVGDFNHPPLHTILVRQWFSVFGAGVAEARGLSAIFGTLAVPAAYWLGALLFNRSTALVAALLLAVSQLGIIYAQEARAYSLLLLLAILALGFFVQSYRRGSRRQFAMFVVVSVVMMYTHYYSAFLLLGIVIWAVVFRRHSAVPLRWWAIALGIGLVAYLPWLTSGVIQSALRSPQNAVVEGTAARVGMPLLAINWFNNGKMAGAREPTPAWALAAGFVLFSGPLLYGLWSTRAGSDREQQSVLLLVISAATCVLAVWLLGLLNVVYDVRHVSFLVGFYYLLVARGVTSLNPGAVRLTLIGAIVAFSALSLRANYFVPYKENYRDAFAVVTAESRGGDCTIFAAPDRNSFAQIYWDTYYHPASPPTLVALDGAVARADCLRAWLLWDKTFWKSGLLTYADVQTTLSSSFAPDAKWSFTGVDLQLFVRRNEVPEP